jgi:hypothetical protein
LDFCGVDHPPYRHSPYEPKESPHVDGLWGTGNILLKAGIAAGTFIRVGGTSWTGPSPLRETQAGSPGFPVRLVPKRRRSITRDLRSIKLLVESDAGESQGLP